MTKRLVAAALLVTAAVATPAAAAPSGYCDGKVDVVCRTDRCQPDYPCTPTFCLVWTGNACRY